MLQHGGDETDQRRALSDNDDLEKKLCKQAVFQFVRKHILEVWCLTNSFQCNRLLIILL